MYLCIYVFGRRLLPGERTLPRNNCHQMLCWRSGSVLSSVEEAWNRSLPAELIGGDGSVHKKGGRKIL